MIPNPPRRERNGARQDRRAGPARRRWLPVTLRAPILAAILAGALLALPVADVAAQEQDTPAEDTPAEDPPAEDTPAEDTPAEDPPAEDPPTEDDLAVIPGFAMGISEAPPPDATPEGTFALISGFFLWIPDAPPEDADEAGAGECPQPAPIGYRPDLATWNVSCVGPALWVAELTCGEAYLLAGRTVRFATGPNPAEQPSMYDLCGYLRCPSDAPGSAPATLDEAGVPNEADVPEVPDEADVPDEASDDAPLPDETARTEDTAAAGHGSAPDDGTARIEDTAATGDGSAPPESIWEIPAESCGGPWPPGTWHGISGEDPILGAMALTSRLSGRWLGVTDHTARAVPSLSLTCTADAASEATDGAPDDTAEPTDETPDDTAEATDGAAPSPADGLTVTIRTGGAIAAAYGRGVPVEYRIGDTIGSQEWLEAPGGRGSDAGVSVPAWLVAYFVTLIRLNPEGDFVMRVLGHDGTAVGTARFDLSGFEPAAEPILDRCGF